MEKKPQLIEKENAVATLAAQFAANDGVILADYRGLNVAEITTLRSDLRKAGAHYEVAKNTLIKRAANSQDITCLDEFLEGPTAIAFSTDPAGLAKTMGTFAKAHPKLQMKAGVCEGTFLDAAGLDKLSKLPSRDQLLGQIAGCMQGVIRGFVYALDQIAKQKEGETEIA